MCGGTWKRQSKDGNNTKKVGKIYGPLGIIIPTRNNAFWLKKKTRENNGFSHEIACEFPNQSIEAFNPSSSSQAAASVEAATEPVANGQTCHLR